MNEGFISSMIRVEVVFMDCFDVVGVKKTHAKLIYSSGFYCDQNNETLRQKQAKLGYYGLKKLMWKII